MDEINITQRYKIVYIFILIQTLQVTLRNNDFLLSLLLDVNIFH